MGHLLKLSWLYTAPLIGALFASPLFAQAEMSPDTPHNIHIQHTPPDINNLPAPGEPIDLTVTIYGIKDTSPLLRVIMNRDGHFIDRSVGNAFLNELDHPTYKVKAYAPLAQLTYQFILMNHDGTAIATKEYVLTQKCTPKVDLIDLTIGNSTQVKEQITVLTKQATKLESELQSYQTAIDLVKELKELIEK